MSKNKHGVEVGQVWKDNDKRVKPERLFEIMSVDLNFYPSGRAECRLVDPEAHRRPVFFARLNRFNGTQRGYSLVDAPEAKKPAKKKPTKKKVKK